MTGAGGDEQRGGLGSAVQWILALAFALAALEGLLEAAFVVLRTGDNVAPALAGGVLSAALSFLLVACAAPLLLVVAASAGRLGRMKHGARLGVLLLALASAPIALTISDPRGRQMPAAYIAIALAAALLVAAAGFLSYATPRANGRIAALLLGAGAVALDAAVGPEAYPEVHGLCLLVLVAALASALADFGLRRPAPGARALLAAFVVPTALCGVLVASLEHAYPQVYSLPVLHGRNVVRVASWLRWPFDRDGDGFASVLWGLDCDDRRGDIYPGATDPPGQGDQNCNGVDGATHPPAEFFASTPLGSATLPRGLIERVVLLSLDTFRPELLRADVMPNLTAFAARGARYQRSYASDTTTLLSVPLFHRPTLHEPSSVKLLTAAGIDSYAFAITGDFPHRAPQEDDTVVPAVLKTLNERGTEPTFVWAHFMGMHAPYVTWPDRSSPPQVANFPASYVSEAMHLDDLLAPLLAWLAAPERLGRSVVLVTGDHGEGFGEHGAFSHTRLGWEEMIRTPIVLVAPGLAAGDYPHLASHRDFPATIVGAFGIDPERAGLERFGRSMLRAIGHERTPLRRAVVSHSSRRASGALGHGPLGIMIDGADKIVVGITDGVVERYDLSRDPQERRDLAPSTPELTARLVEKLSRHLDAEKWPAAPNRIETERQRGDH